jgi:predicted nucleic acid-binding protein
VILCDTSVVIEYAQGIDAKLVALLPKLPATICGVTRAEALCGARNPMHPFFKSRILRFDVTSAVEKNLPNAVQNHHFRHK